MILHAMLAKQPHDQLSTIFVLIVTVLMGISCHHVTAQQSCKGMLTGTITSGVVCTGDCVLNGATVTGNVDCSIGSLTTKGGTVINGNIAVSGGVMSVTLDDVNVFGTVEVTSASLLVELVIKQGATIGSLSVLNTPGNVVVSGQVTSSLSLKDSSGLFVNGLSTIATVSVQGGNGVIEICDSTLGGLAVSEHTGDIEINANSPTCSASTTFTGSIITCKGSGRIRIVGAQLSSGDLIITEYSGEVVVDQADVGDLTLSDISGSLTISDLTTDSDVSITDVVGNAVLSSMVIQGDFNIDLDGDLTLTDSDFNLEDVSILKITGSVIVKDNVNLNLLIEETSNGVEISNNDIIVGAVNKNTGGVNIIDNTFESLSCADNSPAPIGSGNAVMFPDGQCASGLP